MYAVVMGIQRAAHLLPSTRGAKKEAAPQGAASLPSLNTLGLLLAFAFTLLLIPQQAQAGIDASVEWGLEYDSNVLSNNQLNNDYESDFSNRLGIAIGGDYQWADVMRIKGQYQYTQTRWLEASQYDTDIHTSFLRLSHRQGAWISEGILLHAQAQIEGQDFLTLNRLSPAISVFANRDWYLRAQFDIGEKTFPQYSNRDAQYFGLKPSAYWLINKMQHYVKIQLDVNQERVDNKQYDQQSASTTASWNYKWQKTKITLEAQIEQDQYQNPWPSLGEKREDTSYKTKLKIQHDISKQFSLKTEIAYDEKESNLASSNYDQVRGLLKLKYEW